MSEIRANGTLIVVILKARNLPNRRKLDKQNPYCIARIANIVDRTPAIARGGQTPEWNHESRFKLTSEISPILKLSILDETKKSPVLVGDAEIDCSPVFSTSSEEGYDKWHPLLYAGRTAGEIYVEMTFYPRAPVEPVRTKGTVLYHRNTVRPLPSRPGEEEDSESSDNESTFDYPYGHDDASGSESFNSSGYRPKLYAGNPYRSSGGTNFSSSGGSYASNHSDSSRHHGNSMLNDTIARQILQQHPEKFAELLSRNPDLQKSYQTSQWTDFDEQRGYRKSRSVSPVRRNTASINASFDNLEKEVQTDWYRNNKPYNSYEQQRVADLDPMRISLALPKLPEFTHTNQGKPPTPAHKSIYSRSKGSSRYSRKPPPLTVEEERALYGRQKISPFAGRSRPPPIEDDDQDAELAAKFLQMSMNSRYGGYKTNRLTIT